MARPWRIEYAGACYHVINRGNYRRAIFAGEGAASAFERVLGETAVRFGWRLHAYVVMNNHFHLAVELAEPNLSEGMKWLQGTWIRRFNRVRAQVGRPFQGRYKALLVEPGEAFGRVCHYIHLNPVRAKVVPVDQATSYPHGSLALFPQKKKNRPDWLAPSTVLDTAGNLKDTAAGWSLYGDYLGFLAEDETAKKELTARKLSRGWCIGTKAFKKDMLESMKERGAELERFAGLEPAEVQRERASLWEERLQGLATAAKIDLARLGERKSAPEKVLLAAALKQSSSVSNAWLAQRLVMGQPASASQFVRRFLLAEDGQAAVRRILSRVKT